MIMKPLFTYSDIKYASDEAMFKRAKELFAKQNVQFYETMADGYRAVVQGSQPYRVRLSRKRVDYADCDCYMGQNDTLCKHMLALALKALYESGLIDQSGDPVASSVVLPADAKLHISAAIKKIRSYDGPSRIWFEYQRKLDIAAGMISEALPLLDTSMANTKYLWKIVLRLSDKLARGGVDDSNGTIGGAIYATLERIAQMAKHDQAIKAWAVKNCTTDTGFGFEEELQGMLLSQKSADN